MRVRFLQRACVAHPRFGQTLVEPGDIVEMPDDTILGPHMENTDTGERGVAPSASGRAGTPELGDPNRRSVPANLRRRLSFAEHLAAHGATQGERDAGAAAVQRLKVSQSQPAHHRLMLRAITAHSTLLMTAGAITLGDTVVLG
jgi:hypothetical protein